MNNQQPNDVSAQPGSPLPSPVAQVPAPKKKINKGLLWGVIGGSIGLIIIIIVGVLFAISANRANTQIYTDAYSEAEQLSSAYNEFDGIKTSQIFAKISGNKLSEANVTTYRESAKLVAKHDKALMALTKNMTDPSIKKARVAYIEQRKNTFGKTDNAILVSVEADMLATNINSTCIKPFENELTFLHREGSHGRIVAMLEACELLLEEYGERDDIATPQSARAIDQMKRAFAEMKTIAKQNGSKKDFEERSAQVAASIAESTKNDKPQEKPGSAEEEEFAFVDAIVALRNSLSDKADLSQVDQGGTPAVGIPGVKL